MKHHDCPWHLSPWNSPDKSTGVGWYAFLQGIFPIQRLNMCILHLLHYRWILYHWATGESQFNYTSLNKIENKSLSDLQNSLLAKVDIRTVWGRPWLGRRGQVSQSHVLRWFFKELFLAWEKWSNIKIQEESLTSSLFLPENRKLFHFDSKRKLQVAVFKSLQKSSGTVVLCLPGSVHSFGPCKRAPPCSPAHDRAKWWIGDASESSCAQSDRWPISHVGRGMV